MLCVHARCALISALAHAILDALRSKEGQRAELVDVDLVAIIAFNTLFTGTDDNVAIKAGTYVLLLKGVFALALVAVLLFFGVPRLFK